ncbi:hypothetical protein P7K49_029793 [Saguinus oedipus]|uniref:Uncharacterized protein n=1 Tax=Saguinus oedipus TaxID=9490 RepID=A0ABQ9U8Z5_SAGOE|nr:hypothetical protein P7K49_029793 [Saguinus oedipus]
MELNYQRHAQEGKCFQVLAPGVQPGEISHLAGAYGPSQWRCYRRPRAPPIRPSAQSPALRFQGPGSGRVCASSGRPRKAGLARSGAWLALTGSEISGAHICAGPWFQPVTDLDVSLPARDYAGRSWAGQRGKPSWQARSLPL